MKFEELQAKTVEHGERNDCAVKATVVLCGVSYAEAHAALENHGRKYRQRAKTFKSHRDAIKSLGFELVEEQFPGKTVVTLERDLKRYARGRKFLIEVRGHSLAFDGEEIVDWSQGRRHRITKVYRVKRVNTPERGTVTGRLPISHKQSEGQIFRKPAQNSEADVRAQVEFLDLDFTKIEARVQSWMRDLPRPQGAPKKGTRVVQTIANNETFEGEVIGYLSSQFIIDTGNGERVIAIGDEWAVTS